MTRSRSSIPLLVACATLLAGASIDGAFAQVNTPDLGSALQKAMSDRQGRALPAPSVPIPAPSFPIPAPSAPLPAPSAPPERAARAPAAPTADFTLIGVVIAGPTRLALLQEGKAKHSGAHLLRIGASLGGLKLTDVQEDHVTLEGSGGERVTVRLSADAGSGSPSASPPPAAMPSPARVPPR
jgi:hypothetical protein